MFGSTAFLSSDCRRSSTVILLNTPGIHVAINELMLAASQGDFARVREHVSNNDPAVVNMQDTFGNTALIYAASGGHTGIVRLLLAHGADPQIRNRIGSAALERASGNNHQAVVSLLRRAVAGGHVASQPIVIDERAHALLAAARRGDIVEARDLLERGADPEARSPMSGWTPLIVASMQGHTEVALLLLAAGADPDARGLDGWTALRFAVSLADDVVARILINHHADPNLRDADGTTTLMDAAREGHEASVELLLAHGAEPALENRQRESALTLARRYGHAGVVRLLEQRMEPGGH